MVKNNPLSADTLTSLFRTSSKDEFRIVNRESVTIEFKESYSHSSMAQYFKAIAAFANNAGGHLIFGVGDKPRRLKGLTEKSLEQFENIKVEEFTKALMDYFSPSIHWDHCTFEFKGLSFGVIYVHPLKKKPCVCKKTYDNSNAKYALKEGDIYYRYGGRSERIKYEELVSIIDTNRQNEQQQWMTLLQKIAKIGVDNAMLLNAETGILSGCGKSIIFDETLLEQIKFIKEGEFVEVKGQPTLRLIGDIQTVSSGKVVFKETEKKVVKAIEPQDITRSFLSSEVVAEPIEYIKRICSLATAKSLREHNLLQAIARVNRIYKGKDFGLVVDYWGIFGKLKAAIDLYDDAESEMNKYDSTDIEDAILGPVDEKNKLEAANKALWDMFEGITDSNSSDEWQSALEDESKRNEFYAKLKEYANLLNLALTSRDLFTEVGIDLIQKYRDDYIFFNKLRRGVIERFDNTIDLSKYEAGIKNLLDTFVHASEVKIVVDPVFIGDKEAMERMLNSDDPSNVKADKIKTRIEAELKQVRYDDPLLFEEFSTKIRETIAEYDKSRDEDKYLATMEAMADDFNNGRLTRDYPVSIANDSDTKAFYGSVITLIRSKTDIVVTEELEETIANNAKKIRQTISDIAKRDWKHNEVVHKQMHRALDDCLFDMFDEIGYTIDKTNIDVLDLIIDEIITTDGQENASHRYTSGQVKKMIERQKEKYGWEFLFIGANIDAVETAARYGISRDRAVNYNADEKGTRILYDAVADAVCNVRASAPLSADWSDEINADYQKRGKKNK